MKIENSYWVKEVLMKMYSQDYGQYLEDVLENNVKKEALEEMGINIEVTIRAKPYRRKNKKLC